MGTMTDLTTELEALRATIEAKNAANEAAKEAGQAWRRQEQIALKAFERARQDSARPSGLGYTFTAVTDQEKGHVTDRNVFYRHALEQEPSIQEFLEGWTERFSESDAQAFESQLYEALLNLTILKLTESQRWLNAHVKAMHDDEQPLAPGVDFEPVPYVSVTKA